MTTDGDAVWVDGSDGVVIAFCIPKETLDAAGLQGADADAVEQAGGMQAWLERAIITRYYTYLASGYGRPLDEDGRFVLIIRVADFTAH